MAKRDELTDEQWAILEPLIPDPEIRADGKGRPLVHDNRAVMNGVLWVLRTGAAWNDLPDRYPSSTTCFRRFSVWVGDGIMRKILEALAQDLEKRGGIDLQSVLLTAPSWWRKRGLQSGKDQAGQGYEAHAYCRR